MRKSGVARGLCCCEWAPRLLNVTGARGELFGSAEMDELCES